jgi:hypothetical protein
VGPPPTFTRENVRRRDEHDGLGAVVRRAFVVSRTATSYVFAVQRRANATRRVIARLRVTT